MSHQHNPETHASNTVPATAGPAISGERLLSFLTDVREQMEREAQAQTAPELRRATLVALLERQPLQVDSLQALAWLASLYANVGAYDLVVHMLDQQAPNMQAQLPEDERASAAIRWRLWRVDALTRTGDLVASRQTLEAVEQLLQQKPASAQTMDDWSEVGKEAWYARDYLLERRCIQRMHTLKTAQPGRATYAAWDQAVLALDLGHSYHTEGLAEQALQCAADAVNALDQAAPGQDVDYNDWLNLGDRLVAYAPGCIAGVDRQVNARLDPDMPQGARRCVAVKLARLHARAAWHQGQPEEALRIAPEGHYRLTDDEDDRFGAMLLDWLVQAGRWNEAAALAFEKVRDEQKPSSDIALRHCLKQAAEGQHPNAYWHLALALAAITESQAWVCEGQDSDDFYALHLAHAKALAPGYIGIDWLESNWLYNNQQDYAAALPLAERVAQHPAYATPGLMRRLWGARIKVHGVHKALALPFWPCGSAVWNYNTGCSFDPEDFNPPLEDESCFAALGRVKARFYEASFEQFQTFFAGAQVHYQGADLHTFSMLCNNLAIYRRWTEQRLDDAIALHHAGIALSPFAEHYNGLLDCERKKDYESEAYVEAAERLWNYAMDYGYSRHEPAYYIYNVVAALRTLDRAMEIPVWLERLDGWWDALDEEDRPESVVSYLAAMAFGLALVSLTQPQDAYMRLKPLLPLARQHNEQDIFYRISGVLYRADQYPECLEFSQAALAGGRVDEGDQTDHILERIAYCKNALGLVSAETRSAATATKNRPWWQFWN